MANGSPEEWLVKLQESLTQLTIASANVEQKLDVIQAGFEKIERSVEALSSSTAKQEIKISILEQKIAELKSQQPKNISEEFAVIKSQVSGFQKIMWLVSTSIVGLVIKAMHDMLMSQG
jgi:peptidoglycan hydrolase CwlO-like protein